LQRLSAGSFWENEDYLVVADRYQQAVYQLKPESAEVRALPLEPCRPLSVAFDPTANILYIICLENSLYHIQKKTFDGRIDKTLYRVPQGRRALCFSTTFRTYPRVCYSCDEFAILPPVQRNAFIDRGVAMGWAGWTKPRDLQVPGKKLK